MPSPSNKCVSCAYFSVNKKLPHLGECSLELPPWVLERLAKGIPIMELNRTVRVDHSCSFGNWNP